MIMIGFLLLFDMEKKLWKCCEVLGIHAEMLKNAKTVLFRNQWPFFMSKFNKTKFKASDQFASKFQISYLLKCLSGMTGTDHAGSGPAVTASSLGVSIKRSKINLVCYIRPTGIKKSN